MRDHIQYSVSYEFQSKGDKSVHINLGKLQK